MPNTSGRLTRPEKRLRKRLISEFMEIELRQRMKGAPMSEMRTYTLPLGGNRTIDFRAPLEMTEADFEMLIKTLELWRVTLVAKEPETSPQPESIER